jgi:hypothetical protein
MQESLLHYIWQFQYFDRIRLQTTTGEKISVFHPGFRNTHAGPDFLNARIKIGELEWIGNVEIHIHASGWNDHQHHRDPAYDNVVLHVVWKEDSFISNSDGSPMPTLELTGRVEDSLILGYNKILLNPEPIPCAASLANVKSITTLSMLEKALMNRLENKADVVIQMLRGNNNDWEETCYQLLCRNFGFKVNADAFLVLSKAASYRLLLKHADKLIQIEAFLFGQAGFLDESFSDDYYHVLKREYTLLNQKFHLNESKLTKARWKFLRLRPANFPTIRIAQLATLIQQQSNLFSKFLEAPNYEAIVDILSTSQSEYWRHHYLFDNLIEEEINAIGKMSVDNIIVNTVVPLLVAYGRFMDMQDYINRAVDLLQYIDSEQNSIIRTWSQLGLKSKTAFDSQALIELHNNYCLRRKCLDCTIGSSLIRPQNV